MASKEKLLNRRIGIGIGVAVLVAAWWAFRPELIFIDRTVSEPLTVGTAEGDALGAVLMATGPFTSQAHDTVGNASVYDLGGKQILRLTDFETSNGPDVRVYLVAASTVADNETVESTGFIDLGPMKGNIGDQNYDLPADTDLDRYRSVSIWCARFGVSFGAAPLRRP